MTNLSGERQGNLDPPVFDTLIAIWVNVYTST